MDDFIEKALRTEAPLPGMVSQLALRLLHAGMGLATESGEFLDQLKKHVFYGKPLDTVNLKEELGDLLWYMALAMDELDTDFLAEMDRVICKLQVRYPERFNQVEAENRDLQAERKALEQ